MGDTISEAIGKDHDDFDVCYNEIKKSNDDTTKIKWRNQLTWNVARHAISEELTWYPAMEKHMGELGKKLAAEDKEQHMSVRTNSQFYLRNYHTKSLEGQKNPLRTPRHTTLLPELLLPPRNLDG
jgi:hypothetical protein